MIAVAAVIAPVLVVIVIGVAHRAGVITSRARETIERPVPSRRMAVPLRSATPPTAVRETKMETDGVRFCQACGHKTAAHARYCRACGARLDEI